MIHFTPAQDTKEGARKVPSVHSGEHFERASFLFCRFHAIGALILRIRFSNSADLAARSTQEES